MSRAYDRLSAILFASLAVVIAVTFRQYGVSWDEQFHLEFGARVHRFYATYFDADRDLSALTYANMYLYGGLSDLIGFELSRLLPFGEYESRHLGNALMGLLGVLGCWKAARAQGGPAAAFWAALLLVLTPTYYGHMFNNPKDVPLAAGYIWSLYYLLRALPLLPRIPASLALRLGLAVGATIAVRIAGLILFAYVAGAFSVYLVVQSIMTRRAALADGVRLLASFALVVGVAYVIVVMFWPYVATHPFSGPLKALQENTHFRFGDTLRFGGQSISTADLPWSYLPQYLLIQLPEVVLVLLATGMVMGIGWLARGHPASQLRQAGGILVLVVAAAFPVVYIIDRRSVVYDAARHVTFVLPPLACLAGLMLAYLMQRAAVLGSVGRLCAGAVLLLLLQAPLRAMVSLHPYQYVYFNALVGGLPGAAGRYETDYWAHCYREAVLGLTKRLAVEAQEGRPRGPFPVYVIAPWLSATYYFPENLVWTREVREADFGISFLRYDSHKAFAGNPVYFTVERLGTPLCYVFDLRARRWGTTRSEGQ